jgi:predicted permease
MVSIVTAILPVFLLIFLGSWLQGRGFPGSGFWQPAERLTYRIFFPALIVTTLSGADLSGLSVLPMAGALVAAILLMAAGMVAAQRIWRVDGPAFTSMVQGSVRMNVYICLSIAGAVWGSAGLTVAAIAIAVIVPTVNLICVIALARWGSAAEPTVLGTIKQVLTNPLIIAAVLGALSNFTGMPIVVGDVLDILGRAALPIGLLCVGAALDWPAVRRNARAVAQTTALKLIAMPALTAVMLWAFGVEGLTAAIALLFMASPTATSSYILARQLGGDATLMAGVITLQTAVSMVSLPVILTLAG